MDSLDFYNAVKDVIEHQHIKNQDIKKFFLDELESLLNKPESTDSLCMTHMSILFEGFYKHINDASFKEALGQLRSKRWSQHFGTPTIAFLLSYAKQIAQTKDLFEQFQTSTKSTNTLPWIINSQTNAMLDELNSVIIDSTSISKIEVPAENETTGVFTKTYNPFGGFTTSPCDPFSQKFIEHAEKIASNDGKMLEVGAGFGAATLAALAKGATVFCNDISPENLAVVQKRYMASQSKQAESVTGDINKLVLVPGELPHELTGLPAKAFDAILICRVLHFFKGKKIEESLALLSKLLTPGGKIYIVCETPYLKNWQKFIPEFNRRVMEDIEWPGEIANPADYESSGRAASLPSFVHWITKEILERSLQRIGLSVGESAYINRTGQFPDDLLLPEYGQESVGAIGVNEGYGL